MFRTYILLKMLIDELICGPYYFQVPVYPTDDIFKQPFWVSITSDYHKMVHGFSSGSLSCHDLYVLESL